MSRLTSSFNTTYDGLPAATCHSHEDYERLTSQLRMLNLSFLTKVVRTRNKGRWFVVMLVENLDA